MEDATRNEELKGLLEKIDQLQVLLSRRPKAKTVYKGQGYRLLKVDMGDVTAPQAVTVVEILAAIGAGKEAVSEKAVLEAMERNRELFDITGEKQTPTTVFKYYRPQLRDAGIIEVVKATDKKVVVA